MNSDNVTSLLEREMSIPVIHEWPKMSVDRYAALAEANGDTMRQDGEIWWRKIRPFFYRPLLPFKRYSSKNHRVRFSSFQHAVNEGEPHNSYLNVMMYDVPTYDTNQLDGSAKRNLKAAINNGLTVSRLRDEQEFCASAHDVYLSFYERSHYRFATYRTQRQGFAHWSRLLFRFPELVVLGVFHDGRLLCFEISCLVEGTVLLTTRVHSDTGLELRTPDLMLHYWRVAARQSQEVQMLYDSPLSAKPGINEFKTRRGARVLALPAFLHVNPAVLWLIRTKSPRLHKRILGFTPDEIANTPITALA